MVIRLRRALLVAAVLLGAAQPALAAGEEPPLNRPDGRGLGRVTAIGPADFTVETRRGRTHTLVVDERTTFEDRDGTPRAFSDLEIGMWVAGTYERTAEGRLVARRVVLLGDEPARVQLRAAGQVTAVNPGSQTFTIHTRQGEDLTLTVTAETVFRSPDGSVSGLTDLKPGMAAGVAARRQDGALIAIAVAAGNRPERERATGEITTVHPDAGRFTLRTHDGAALTFEVAEQTRFLSRDHSVNGIHDLRAGMHAAVVYVKRDQTLTALAVAVGDPQDRPRLDVRAAGHIMDVASETFTLKTRAGETLTFFVDERTVFRSREGQVAGLEDLRSGMVAIVGGRRVDGELRAVWVGVGWPGGSPPPSQ